MSSCPRIPGTFKTFGGLSSDMRVPEYHDHSQSTEVDVAALCEKRKEQVIQEREDYDLLTKGSKRGKPRAKCGPRGGVYDPFPIKLHRMLDEAERLGMEDVMCWMPHGRAFKVHKQAEFCDKIMPKFFKQSKWTSFTRQLNLYGFNRITRDGPDLGAHYHELFLRGKPFLCKAILRTKFKGDKFKYIKHISCEFEPDFYAMSPVGGGGRSSENASSSSEGSTSSEEEEPPRQVETQQMTSAVVEAQTETGAIAKPSLSPESVAALEAFVTEIREARNILHQLKHDPIGRRMQMYASNNFKTISTDGNIVDLSRMSPTSPSAFPFQIQDQLENCGAARSIHSPNLEANAVWSSQEVESGLAMEGRPMLRPSWECKMRQLR